MLQSPPITKPGRGRKRLTWLFGIGSLIGVIFIIYMTITALNLTKPETDEPTAISLSASETSPSATSISTPTLIPLVPPQNAQLGDRWTRRADNMVMVFVPGDTFLMGIDPVQNPDVYSDKFPQHEVILSSFG
ncbi:MAG: hypothetical protein IPL78_33905 [Chloroflexi bacterium]|nr:hypothetical protein [Chloroflexota bacterium]